MILLHRLQGEAMFLNCDLIESIEATPDTVLTMVDGRRLIVIEPPAEVVARVTAFRASVIVAADELRPGPRPSLRILPPAEA